MRIARFSHADDVAFGVIEGPGEDPADLVVAVASGHPFAPLQLTGESLPLSSVKLLAPVLPSKVVCIGKNYADHIAEMGGSAVPESPVVFLKPSTSVIGPGDAIALPRNSERVDHEAELGIVIGRLCREVPRERAFDVVLGYTCGNDVTARDHQKQDGQWTRGKGHDTFCPLGPVGRDRASRRRRRGAVHRRRGGAAGRPHVALDPRHPSRHRVGDGVHDAAAR